MTTWGVTDSVIKSITLPIAGAVIEAQDSDTCSWQFKLKTFFRVSPVLAFLALNFVTFGIPLAVANTPGVIDEFHTDIKSGIKSSASFFTRVKSYFSNNASNQNPTESRTHRM
jgi:hypothetical protein